MKKRIYIIISALLVLIIVFGIAYCVLAQKKIDTAYNNAVTLIQNGSYEAALDEFNNANPKRKINRDNFWRDAEYGYIEKLYKNSLLLYAYALAQIEYNGKKSMVTVDDYLDLIPEYYSGELSKEIKTFRENFQSEYEVYLAEEARKAEEKRKADLKNRVPYVGMSESDIANTSLGKPSSDVRHNYEMISGKSYQANLYDFKQGSKTIFTARCVQGKVTEVWDKRNETTKSTSTPSTTRKKKTYNDDKYNAKDYYDAEDFYDDHYDDFYDYEEAEDYYNENGMW